jgi:hypothetical protein
MRKVFRNFTATAFCVVALTLATGATALADGTITPATGQHGSNIGNSCGTAQASVFPGNAANASGSPFNSAGQAGNVYAGNTGTSSLNANNTATVSQYDVACLSLTTH